MSPADVLLVVLPWEPSPEWRRQLSKAGNGLEVVSHKIEMYEEDKQDDIPDEIWARTTVLFTKDTFPSKEKTPKLKYVQLLSAGCNQILNRPIFTDTETSFCTANGVHPPQIAEWVYSTFLAFQHHLPEYWNNQRDAKWIDPVSDEDTEDAVGLTVGTLGYGCVARQVASVGRALGMNVHAYTLHERKTAEERKDDSFHEPGLGDPDGVIPSKWYAGSSQLNDFLNSGLDLLVITLPLTPATRGMLGAEQFKLLSKRKAYLSNAGRGGVVDTDALVAALESGQLRGAALDVTDPEPLNADSPLWAMKNVIITPHCAGNSTHYNERTLAILKYNLERLNSGNEVVNRVSKELGY